MNSVVCSSCNFNIGKVITIYQQIWTEIRLDYLRKTNKVLSIDDSVSITNIMHDHEIDLQAGPLLDILDVKNECCRVFVLSAYKQFSPYK
jgi:DNA-directed RNA polymerase subunit N (RpoN/RPB10)